ncbi:SBBP repeat-containing protein [Spirosoma arboris]|nr:SBBP repeat-containing protein [Spirosoma arboris]
MKNNYFILLGLILVGLICIPSFTQAQNYKWARGIGGSGSAGGNSIAVDGAGNVYTTGSFQGTITGVANLTASGFDGLFLFKHDGAGNLVWAKSIDFSQGTSLAVDGSGNVYVTGNFYNTVDFDPGPDQVELNPSEGGIFVLKLNTSGNFLWVKQLQRVGSESGRTLVVDGAGNAYTTSGLGDESGRVRAINKLDGATGNLVWAKSLDGAQYEFGFSVAVDGAGNVFTAGSFFATVDFDPGPGTASLTSAGNVDVFIQKLDKDGNFVWVKQMGGPGEENCRSIALDGLGNIYTTGHFFSSNEGLADFDPGEGVAYLTGTSDGTIFVSKLDVSGKFLWARELTENSYNTALSIAVDGSSNAYITGYFRGTTDFDPGDGEANLTASDSNNGDCFICKLDQLGHYVWARQLGGTDGASGNSIAVDGSGNVYTTGDFSGTVYFDPGDGVANLTTSSGRYDIFISKLEQVPIITGLMASPNPVCVGSPITLTATVSNLQGTTYSFSLTSGSSTITGSSSNPRFSQNLTASGSGNQSISLTVSNNGKSTSISTSVTINPLPTPGLTNNGPLTCAQSSVTLTASGGTSYHFSSLASQQGGSSSSIATVSQPGLYSVTVIAANGCTATASALVTTSANLEPPSLLASATNTTNQPISVTASGCGGTLTWMPQGGTGAASGSIYTLSAPGTYSLSASCTVGSCISPASPPLSLTILPAQATFALLGVSLISCQPVSATEQQITFLPQYQGLSGEPIVLAIAYDNFITTGPGPYTLRVPTSMPLLTLIAQQGSKLSSYNYRWLDACQTGVDNHPPTTRGIVAQAAQQGQAYSLGLLDYFSDPDGQALHFQVSGLPSGLNLTGSVIGGIPVEPGVSTVNVTGIDPGGLSVTTSFVLTVNPSSTPNRAPVTPGIPAQVARQGQGYSLGLLDYFSDPDGQALHFEASGLPSGLNLTGSVISGIPSVTGVSTVSVTAFDPLGLSVSTSFEFTVSGQPIQTSPFALVGVSLLNCQSVSASERQVTILPQYTGESGEGIVLAITTGLITTQPGPYVLILPTNQPLITLIAQQGSVTSSYNYRWLDGCLNGGRLASPGEPSDLQVVVLGNPVVGNEVWVEVRGALGDPLELSLIDGRGQTISHRRVAAAEEVERHEFRLDSASAGLLFLGVSTPTQQRSVKVLKRE